MAEICTFCLAEATDYYEFKTDKHSFYQKGDIKPACPRHLELLKAKGY